MQKKVLSNIVLILAVNLLIKPFWILGVDRHVQNSVGNEAYGQYINVFTISLLFAMVLDFGVNNYTSSFIAKHPQMLQKKFGALFPLKIIFSVFYLLLTLLFGWMYGLTAPFMMMLLVLSVNQILSYFTLFFRANISGLQLFRQEAFLSVADRGLMIFTALLLALFFSGNLSIPLFIAAQTIGYLGACFIALFFLLKPLQQFSIKFDRLLVLAMLKKSWPYALLALLMTVYTRSDYLLMKKLRADGDIQNGIYAVANRLLEAANMFAVLISGLLLPVFSNMLKNRLDLRATVKAANVLLIFPAFVVAFVALFYGSEIMRIINHTSPEASAEVFKWVMFSFVSLCIMYIYGTLLTANGNLKILNILAAIALVINLGLNQWFIPHLGAKGAAITAVITQAFIAVFNTGFAFKKIPLGIEGAHWLKLSIAILGMFLLLYACSHFGVSLLPAMLCVSGFSILILRFTRLVEAEQVRQMFQRN
ncbi:MAG: oligosaccharide flippase family protein [Bacteroidota bacterium]|jgi:O-antigen/teichoic acid export membrane protein